MNEYLILSLKSHKYSTAWDMLRVHVVLGSHVQFLVSKGYDYL